jgi:hypothetical protein
MLNASIAKANNLMLTTCDFLGWRFQNNYFILLRDLSDTVHFGVSGVVRIHRALSHSLREVLGTGFGVHV